ncbi:hypothetical protein EXT51_03155 [Pectobacterium carotovorum subsp. carotovorum]|uniref:hypothetical protein n=1 Tax=Pectobacterium carotovorum TaxID=554 RepID=UPI00202DA867|nr:hypothetical protein [Pectobacterium carotovorum]MCL6328500.1 hypothetical protein [Pectobacterium carotovorum subsp. carotovorum]
MTDQALGLDNTSIVEQVSTTREIVQDIDQQRMIEGLRQQGLLKSPEFSLAYGPNTYSTIQARN